MASRRKRRASKTMTRKERANKMKPYKSLLEKRVASILQGAEMPWHYEAVKFTYTFPKTYTCDFTPASGRMLALEVKGRFRTSEEAQKYIHIRNDNPDLKLVFVFQRKDVKMPRARIKTQEQWCEANNFEYTYEDELLDWLKEHDG